MGQNGTVSTVPAGVGDLDRRRWPGAIAALLEERSLLAAAKRAKIAKTTLYRWLQEPDFQTAYQAAASHAYETVLAGCQADAQLARETLAELLDSSQPPMVRLGAARALIDTAGAAYEVSRLVARLAALEQRVGVRRAGPPVTTPTRRGAA